MRLGPCALALLLALSSCNNTKSEHPDWSERRTEMEIEGQELLATARHYLDKKDYAAARTAIDSLRRQCPYALSARAEGIQLLDSICLFEAMDDLVRLSGANGQAAGDSASAQSVAEAEQRVKFYQRKLRHDQQ